MGAIVWFHPSFLEKSKIWSIWWRFILEATVWSVILDFEGMEFWSSWSIWICFKVRADTFLAPRKVSAT